MMGLEMLGLFFSTGPMKQTFNARQKIILELSISVLNGPFVTAYPEIFYCKHHFVIPESDLYFTFVSALKCIVENFSW